MNTTATKPQITTVPLPFVLENGRWGYCASWWTWGRGPVYPVWYAKVRFGEKRPYNKPLDTAS